MDDFRIPDNEGNQVIDEPVFSDGDNAYFVKLPVKAMVQNIQKNKIPASVSYTAGTFITYALQDADGQTIESQP